jgi:hypothetical protein
MFRRFKKFLCPPCFCIPLVCIFSGFLFISVRRTECLTAGFCRTSWKKQIDLTWPVCCSALCLFEGEQMRMFADMEVQARLMREMREMYEKRGSWKQVFGPLIQPEVSASRQMRCLTLRPIGRGPAFAPTAELTCILLRRKSPSVVSLTHMKMTIGLARADYQNCCMTCPPSLRHTLFSTARWTAIGGRTKNPFQCASPSSTPS